MDRGLNYLLLCLLVGALLGVGLAALVRTLAGRPDVHVSYLTQECVQVINADGSAGDCAKLPENYNKIWVD